MRRKNDFTLFMLLGVFLSIAFGGILVKIFNNSSLIIIKKILPEICLILFLLSSFYKRKIKINISNFILLLFLLAILIYKLIYGPSIGQIISTFRDFFIPIFIMLYIGDYKRSDEEYIKYMQYFYSFFIVFIFISVILTIIQYTRGIQWTSEFYLERSIIGTDIQTGIKIDSYMGVLRVPSVTGNHVIFGVFNYFAIVFIFYYENIVRGKFKIISYVAVILALVNIILCTSRTVIIMTGIFGAFMIVRYYKKLLIIIIPIGIYVFNKIILSENSLINMLLDDSSMNIRVNNVWSNILSFENDLHTVFGRNIYDIANDSYNQGIAVIDNMYIFVFITIGIVGIILLSIILLRVINVLRKDIGRVILISSIIPIMVGGVFTDFFQGRVLTVYFLLIILMSRGKRTKNEDNVDKHLLLS